MIMDNRKRMRSLAMALGLGALVVVFYAATIVRFGIQHHQTASYDRR